MHARPDRTRCTTAHHDPRVASTEEPGKHWGKTHAALVGVGYVGVGAGFVGVGPRPVA